MENNNGLPFRLGATLYSFNADYYTYKRSFEDCMQALGSLGPGQGVEIVFQQFERHYPELSPEFENRFKTCLEKYDLVPTVFSGYDDPGAYWDEEESLDYMVKQMRAAHQLGFKIARLFPSRPEMVERLLPYAEKYDVVLCKEVHCPQTVETFGPVLEILDKLDSPYLGIFPDLGTMCRKPGDVYVERFREMGLSEKVIELVLEMWHARATEPEMLAAVKKLDGSELAELMVREAFIYFGHGEPSALEPVMKHVKHIHGKFFHVNEQGEDAATRTAEVVALLKKAGYTGSYSAEYEGHHWNAGLDALTELKRYQAFVRKCYAEAP